MTGHKRTGYSKNGDCKPVCRILGIIAGILLVFALCGPPSAAAQTAEEEQALSPDPELKGTLPRLSIEDQETADDPADILTKIRQLPEDMQEEFWEEGDRAFSYCQTNYTLSRNLNCSCYAFKHIEARFNEGPELPFYNLINKVDMAPCIFVPAVAGTNYERCRRVMRSKDYAPEVLDALCRCVSDKMVTAQKNRPTLRSTSINNLFTERLISCIEEVVNPY